jgi:hypothetical protein
MPDLAAARAALKNVEGILRRRYHYPHPIFEHLAAAQGHIVEEPKKAPAKAPPVAAPKRKENDR